MIEERLQKESRGGTVHTALLSGRRAPLAEAPGGLPTGETFVPKDNRQSRRLQFHSKFPDSARAFPFRPIHMPRQSEDHRRRTPFSRQAH
jgi:hypothetical protein